MKGRPKGGVVACKKEANRRYVECYQSCGPSARRNQWTRMRLKSITN